MSINNSVTLLDIQDKLDNLSQNLLSNFAQVADQKMLELQEQIVAMEDLLRTELGQEILLNIALNNNLQGYFKCDKYTILIDESNYNQRYYTVPVIYRLGTNNLKVYYEGLVMRKGDDDDYLEINENTIMFHYDLQPGLALDFEVTNSITTNLQLFELPIATAQVRGCVKQGDNIQISSDGVISAILENIPAVEVIQDSTHRMVTNTQIARWNDTYTKNEVEAMVTSYGHPIATATKPGLVKPGDGFEVSYDGTLKFVAINAVEPTVIKQNDQYQFVTTYERELVNLIPEIIDKLDIPFPPYEPDPDDYQMVTAEEKAMIAKIPEMMVIFKELAKSIAILNRRNSIPNSDMIEELIKEE